MAPINAEPQAPSPLLPQIASGFLSYPYDQVLVGFIRVSAGFARVSQGFLRLLSRLYKGFSRFSGFRAGSSDIYI